MQGESKFREILWDEIEDGIVRITFNRPDVRNAVGLQMASELIQAFRDVNARTDIRTVIITGAGDKAFCAGANLKERRTLSPDKAWELVHNLKVMVTELEAIEVPVIAAVNGFALAGGTHYAIGCDLRVAATHAKFGLTEVKIGIIPGGPAVKLCRLMGRGKVNELILTGRWFTAQEAKEMGLIEHVVPEAELMNKVMELAREIAANAPLAVKTAKKLIKFSFETNLAVANELQELARYRLEDTEDCKEGLAAFAEKRPPHFKGR